MTTNVSSTSMSVTEKLPATSLTTQSFLESRGQRGIKSQQMKYGGQTIQCLGHGQCDSPRTDLCKLDLCLCMRVAVTVIRY